MRGNRWLEEALRPLVLALMVGAVGLSLVSLVRLFFPAWDGRHGVGLLVLATVEAHASHRLLRAYPLRGTERLRFRLVEGAMLFLLVRVGTLLAAGLPAALAELRTWPAHPQSVLLEIESVALFVAVLLAWDASNQTLHDLDTLDGPPRQVTDRSFNARWADTLSDEGARPDSRAAMERLTSRFLHGGALLLVMAGVARVGLTDLVAWERSSTAGALGNVLFYFLLGLVMLGLVRYASLRRRWEVERLRVGDEIAGRWVRGVLGLVGGATVLAFLLPSGYSVGLLGLVGGGLTALLSVASFLALLLFFLLTLPFVWLAWLLTRLLGNTEVPPPTLTPPTLPPLVPPSATGAAPPDWYELIRSLLFWAVLVGLLIIVVRAYLHDHPTLLPTLRAFRPVRALLWLLKLLRGGLTGIAAATRTRLDSVLPHRAPAPPDARSFRFFRLGALSPREQLLLYYRRALRRAAEQGLPRRPAQTPHEYVRDVGPHLPEAEEALTSLTDAFTEARYSQHPIGPAQARSARAAWHAIRRVLRERGKNG